MLRVALAVFICFFLQVEDGIRDGHVTGVQTCSLPISSLWDRCLKLEGVLAQPPGFRRPTNEGTASKIHDNAAGCDIFADATSPARFLTNARISVLMDISDRITPA